MAHQVSFFSLVFLLCSLNQAASEVYHIKTNSGSIDHCIAAPCLTLPEFAINLTDSSYSDITLIFLPGTHYLTVTLLISNGINFSMTSKNITAQIVCKDYSYIHFNHSQYISIANLEFIGCGSNHVEHVQEFVINHTKFSGQTNSHTALEIIETATQIINSTFEFNRKGKFKHFLTEGESFLIFRSGFIGGAIIAIGCEINISRSKFENNGADCGGAVFARYSVIIIHNSIFTNNFAVLGGALSSLESNITIAASKFDINRAEKGRLSSIIVHNFGSGIIATPGLDDGGGVLHSLLSTVTIEACKFDSNKASRVSGGGVLYSLESNITIESSKFDDNTITSGRDGGGGGGVLYSLESTIAIDSSKFDGNTATTGHEGGFHGDGGGGVLYSFKSTVAIESSKFDDNTAASATNGGGGGVLHSLGSTIIIEISIFDGNTAVHLGAGGVLYCAYSTITIGVSEFNNNFAIRGGVSYSEHSSITIVASRFSSNLATPSNGVLGMPSRGGVLYSESSTIIIDSESECINNTAISEGGVLFSHNSTITIITLALTLPDGNNFDSQTTIEVAVCTNLNSSLQIVNNRARYAAIYLTDSELHVEYSGCLLSSNNTGSLIAFNSNITFMGFVEFTNNNLEQPSSATQFNTLLEGGAITLFQSNAFFNGNCSLQYNHAENGGGLLSIESKLYVSGDVTIAHNTAIRNGGGAYLSNSELTCLQKSTFLLNNNHAGYKGGGLHAVSSFIKAKSAYLQNTGSYIGARLNFTKNIAEVGGGLSLEANAKLYILKYDQVTMTTVYSVNTTVFTANTAHLYGGAVYVDDDTNSGTCANSSKTECFFQVLAVHGQDSSDLRTQSIYFSQNQANISGSTLYGGLLDRCAISQFAEVRYKYRHYYENGADDDAIAYFRNVSVPVYYRTGFKLGLEEVPVATNISISSDPVKVCLCINNEPNCSHQAHIKVTKGEAFNVSLIAVDQIEQPVDATIHASLKFPQSGLSEGQLSTVIQAECTDLTFNVVSRHKLESLTLYALDGPCKDADLSKRVIEIHFLPCNCPIGFQRSGKTEINCTCDCHSNISQYAEFCDSHTGTFVKKSQSRTWISYINDSKQTGYLVYPNCPFDYCNALSLPIDLNQPNGADVQCAFNRSSLLCGSCQPGLSLSLSSSLCLQCSRYWPVYLIATTLAAILAGIALVALLLLLNMTIAVGSLNGLIFYANIIYANKSVLLPFQETNLVTVFVSLLNLELGVDTCFFPGMDTHIKTWLQLAFPAYIILLVALVIIISSYSIRFSKLIGKKDPVATLGTLILLSYAKILEICFESLSVGTLIYPDGSKESLWLPDATVKYISGKHIPLFVAAFLILMAGFIYTILIFSWQWLLYLPDWKITKWTRDQKLQTFIETHHAPFTPNYRYWAGLLLIARAILYLVAAVNVSNDPQLALFVIIFCVSFIVHLRSFLQSKVYRNISVNILEIFFFLNLFCFSIFTWYSLNNTKISQKAVAYISVLSTLFVLLLIILYHVCTYTSFFLIIKQTRPFRIIYTFITRDDEEVRRHLSLPPDDDIHRFNELLDVIDRPVNTDDYRVPLLWQKPTVPTQTVVEVCQPYRPPPDPQKTNARSTLIAAETAKDDVICQHERLRKESKV